MRAKLVAGNWKLNGSLAENQALLKAILPPLALLKGADFAVCVPFPYLAQAQQALQGQTVALGAQDVCQFESGAYTGGVSAAMIADFGCRYAIVGHSERRSVFGDTDEIVAEKFAAVMKQGMTPILCVGETLAEREGGVTETVVARQLDAVVKRNGIAALGKSVIAYEPVWAIGTGRTASPEQAQAVHAYIRERVGAAERLPILYGGSVKAGNAAQLFAMADVDGGLIGGASLVAEEFVAICRAAAGAKDRVTV
ncbi:MAG: triose-phosphate isomerase [Betaproteobacteria bacterium]|nr:triose-phosphate isomerase [Betaproteobacteria bacterium]MDH3436445.1 triose-phosphate isomerase [Betaproteobacteria bacterium]